MGNTNNHETCIKSFADLDALYIRETLYKENHSLVIHYTYLKSKDAVNKIISILDRCKDFKLTIYYTVKKDLDTVIQRANHYSTNWIYDHAQKIKMAQISNKKTYDDEWDGFGSIVPAVAFALR